MMSHSSGFNINLNCATFNLAFIADHVSAC